MPHFYCFVQMLLDPTGGIVMTNDGNAILREVRVTNVFICQHCYDLSAVVC